MDVLDYVFSFVIFLILQSLFINGMFDCFQKGNILYPVRLFLSKYISEYFQRPLFSCIKCMSSVYGAGTFWPLVLYWFGFNWFEVYLFIFDVGILVYLNFWLFKRL